MILQSLYVQNFRSLLDVNLTFNDLTVLVGPNGAGKSALLTAIRLLQDPTGRDPTLTLGETDFYNRDTSGLIAVEGAFVSLTRAETRFFDRYVREGRLVVRREFAWVNGAVEPRGSASHLSTVELERVSQAGSVVEKKQLYQGLMAPTDSPYHDMPQQWTTREQFETDKLAWIQKHANLCSLLPDGDFFGPKGKGTSYLKDRWEILYIRAVQDPADVAQDSKNSALTKLVDMAARNALTGNTEFSKLSAELQSRYSEYLKTHTVDLERLAERVSQNLGQLVPGSSLELKWNTSQNLDVKLPVAVPQVIEDGFSSPITHVGSGLQRACTISLLQQLAASSEARTAGVDAAEGTDSVQELPTYMVIVEEPELYQHPDRQRHLAQVFSQLASQPVAGVSSATQVCYCTHSPLFVCMDRFEDIRLCRKTNGANSSSPKQTTIKYASIDVVKKALLSNDNSKLILSKLQTIMTPLMNEGFFAHTVVLVEGEDDRGAVLGTAKRLGYDFEGMGIAVIPCTGKNNLDRPWAGFSTLGIPVYMIWDSDEDLCKNPAKCECSQCNQVDTSGKPLRSSCNAFLNTNEHLLKVQVQTPASRSGRRVEDGYACFENNLEETLKTELTLSVYEELFERAANELGVYRTEHAIKNPIVIKNMLELAADGGRNCPTLEQIVKRIIQLAD